MPMQGAAPTCLCGSRDFDEVRISLPAVVLEQVEWVGGAPAKAVERPTTKDVWARMCNTCSQVTLWSKPSGKENFVRK
jgi:hypothetical protein